MKPADIAAKRYATKLFDPTKKISDEDFAQILAVLRLSPSSVNSQPWHFVITNNDDGKSRIAKSCHGPYEYNKPKVLDASHCLICCIRTDIDNDYLEKLADQEERDGRYVDAAAREKYRELRTMYVGMRKQLNDIPIWATHQLFLNMGATLFAAGQMGMDAVPMEGIDTAILDEEFNLPARGYKAIAAISFGYASADDFNAKLPKSRLPEEDIIEFV